MTGMVILDVVIGVVFVYLLLSLLCTAINEWIASLFSLRAKNLRSGVAQLLGNPLLQKLVYEHPLIMSMRQPNGWLLRLWTWIAGLWRGAGAAAQKVLRDPSYLASVSVARTLVDLFLDKTDHGYVISDRLKDPEKFRAEMERILGKNYAAEIKRLSGIDLCDAAGKVTDEARKQIVGRLEGALKALTGGDALSAEVAEKRIGEWFDSSMERVSGWYKRRIQKIALAVGILVAVGFNASTTTMVASLAHDQDLRSRLAATGVAVAQKCTLEQLKNKDDRVCGIYVEGLKSGDSAIPLPLGWYEPYYPGKAVSGRDLGWVLNALIWLIGIVATGFAASLGAPFWFEILQKVAKIRSTGKNPLERTASETR